MQEEVQFLKDVVLDKNAFDKKSSYLEQVDKAVKSLASKSLQDVQDEEWEALETKGQIILTKLENGKKAIASLKEADKRIASILGVEIGPKGELIAK